jgi:hypothetical protein
MMYLYVKCVMLLNVYVYPLNNFNIVKHTRLARRVRTHTYSTYNMYEDTSSAL